MAKLVVKLENKILQEHVIKGTMSIGREKGDLILKSPAVSAKHARVKMENKIFLLEDLNSTNGTFVNKGRISTQQLHHGDLINIGKFELEFIDQAEAAQTSDPFMMDDGGMTVMIDTTDIMLKGKPKEEEKPKPEVKKEPRLVLVPKSAADSGRMLLHKLKKETTLMGSGENVDIRVKGFTVANVAATIRRGKDGFYIRFMGGMSKLKVNSARVAGEVKLKPKDRVELGSYTFEFIE
jgi:pSer/pThr/pTyr-binding forkhead associated (FHA) protein